MSGISARSQRWGQGQMIPANKRHRITAEPASQQSKDHGGEHDYLGDDLDDENPFDSINILLDRREAEVEAEKLADKTEQLDDTACRQADSVDNSTQQIQYDELVFSQHNDQFSCHDSLNGDEETSQFNESISPEKNDATGQHFFGSTDEQREKTTISDNNKRTKQYSIIKSSTPRFTFQSTMKATALQTPSHKQSIPNRNLFSSHTTQKFKSAKLTQRHTFRKSIEKTGIKDARNLECTPSFLLGRKRTEGISPGIALAQGPSSTFASLKSSVTHDTKPNASRGGKAGYLIQRLRSLRNNDQRIAMRLRSGQLSSGSVLARKRRRSSELFDAKNSIKTELLVTVSNISQLFGENRRMIVCYVHRFECANGDVDEKLNVPCFAWLILSNDVIREQGMNNGTVTNMKFYDATIIQKRMLPTESLSMPIESAMPTIVCGSTCEQHSSEIILPDVSFDKFVELLS